MSSLKIQISHIDTEERKAAAVVAALTYITKTQRYRCRFWRGCVARKRLKDRSDFSIMVKFPEEKRWAAQAIINFAKNAFPAVKITEQLPELGQRYVLVLVEIYKNKGCT